MIPARLPFCVNFGVVLEALGSFLAFRSDLGEILEGLNRRSGKGTFQEAQPHLPGWGHTGTPGGGVLIGRKVWPWGGQQEGQRTDHIPHAC